jgi:cyclophilin family peptidyl-prolyl cis-trans isomerase
MTFRHLALVLLSLGCSEAVPSADGDAAQAKAQKAAPQMVAAKDDPALKAMHEFIAKSKIDTSIRQWKTQLPRPPQVEFDDGSNYFWKMETNKGPIKIRLMPDVAPMHVSSTMFLTEVGFYNDLTFHRVISGFMAQGGCPLGSGRGNPGYSYGGEYDKKVRHDRPGLLSMANTGRPESDGSQFFLTFVPTPHLDGKHTIFGEIVEGMETMRELERFGSPQGQTKEPLLLSSSSIVIERKPVVKEASAEAKEG